MIHFGSSAMHPVDHRTAGTASRWAIVLVVMAAATLLYWVWSPASQARAIHDLPGAERRALYERTLSTLRSPCNPAAGSDGLRDYCRQQAEFIMGFPECGADCASLARQYTAIPTR
jgi:hypothetical protein